MRPQPFDALLRPQTVAVIGGSTRPRSLGAQLLDHIAAPGFSGVVHAVNPHRVDRARVRWCATIADLPVAPDVAIIATPPATVAGVLADLGQRGGKLAVVITAGMHDAALAGDVVAAAKRHGVRLIGPNSLGLILPNASLDASFAQARPRAGDIAFLSQSGAVITAMIDWANDREIGFSGIISLGDTLDIGFSELIDLFAAEPQTKAILLYIEHIDDPRAFLSAVRAAAAIKPVIALKAGRSASAGTAALTHTGKLAGSWDVYVAALRRSGALVVDTLEDLLGAAAVAPLFRRWSGNRVAIVSNGGGPGILAADAVADAGVRLAVLGEATRAALDACLPTDWSHANPIDIIGDAGPMRLAGAIACTLRDPAVDAVLVVHAPTAMLAADRAARACAEAVAREASQKPVIFCGLGRVSGEAKALFATSNIAAFSTIGDATRAIRHLVAAGNARVAAGRTPLHVEVPIPDRERALTVITGAQGEGRTTLASFEARDVVSAFGIPVVASRFARTVDAVGRACDGISAPFAVKLISPDVSHKSDVGGVALNLPTAAAAIAAAQQMLARISHAHPTVRVDGFEVQPMVDQTDKRELLIGIADDPTFGPIIAVGQGGKAAEVIGDRALALPPLDAGLAQDALFATRVSRLLRDYRDVRAADIPAIVRVIEAVSKICVELPDVLELDINPLLVDQHGVVAVDARIRIAAERQSCRLAIRPVPTEWAADLATRDGLALHVRPVTGEDEPLLAELFRHVAPEDLRFRFLTALREVGHDRLEPMVRVDYDRTITFLAFAGETLVSAAMLVIDGTRTRGEVALSIRDGWKKRGISWTLLQHVLRFAKAEGIVEVVSLESADNRAAISLEREMGFETGYQEDDATVVVARKTLVA